MYHKNYQHIVFLIGILTFFCLLLPSCSRSPEIKVITGKTMGTSYQVKIGAYSPAGLENLKNEIDHLLNNINLKMSTYIAESELSRFNLLQSDEWFSVSEETLVVIEKSFEVHERSDGAFDISIGPLVELWGFGKGDRPKAVPSNNTINSVQKRIGMHRLEIDAPNMRIRKRETGIELDLSAIAKGYGVDQVARLLISKDITNFLVEIGGEIFVQGTKNHKQKWTVAVEKADGMGRQAQQLIPLKNLAIATSGSYRNYFEENGVRYSHLINPKTGQPIRHQLVSVSVLASDCMTADAWATALMALGPREGYHVAEKNNIAALFIVKKNDNLFTEQRSPTWNSLLH